NVDSAERQRQIVWGSLTRQGHVYWKHTMLGKGKDGVWWRCWMVGCSAAPPSRSTEKTLWHGNDECVPMQPAMNVKKRRASTCPPNDSEMGDDQQSSRGIRGNERVRRTHASQRHHKHPGESCASIG